MKKSHLRFAFFPGGGGPNEKLDPLYERYVPVLRRLAGAGWEPLTYATAADPDILVERFGSWKSANLCFTLTNQSQSEKQVAVRLDLQALGIAARELAGKAVRDLLDKNQAPAAISEGGLFNIRIAPGDILAVEVSDK